jgi:hypothetical protein
MKKLILCMMLLSACGQGPAGVNGTNGYGCTVSQVGVSDIAPDGGALISCTNGTSSLLLNGTIIQPVQFCPGTPNYPAVFPEVGFKINNQIYAVYSLNNGFLTLLTPGYYSSNAVGSACNFTVNTDGTITN